MWQLPITWIVAGDPRDRNVYLRPPADAFFSRVLTLDALDEKAALKLLRARISQEQASDGLLRAIVAESSRFPRDLIRVATDVIVGGAKPEQLASSRAKREQGSRCAGGARPAGGRRARSEWSGQCLRRCVPVALGVWA